MGKKTYETPRTAVVRLRQRGCLLAGSLTEGAQMEITYEEENW